MTPNILMIVLDAARQDALEPYGAPAGSSPVVAQLARQGIALPDVYATGAWTVPSHASIFTGLMPRAAGLSQAPSPGVVRDALERHADRTLPRVLERAGYSTACASANLWLSAASGFDSVFGELAEIDTDRNARLHIDSIRERFRWAAEAVRASVDDGAASVASALDHWASQPKKPFFWFVNLLECHSPYLPPRPFSGGSASERLRAARDARRYYTLTGIWRACAGVGQVPADALARGRRFYAASIRYMDDWLGRVLEMLDERALLDETLVVVLSDHGENFGEGGLIAHGLSLDNRLLKVPFVAAGPGAEDLELSSLATLPSLIAGCAGLEEHPFTDGPPAGFGVGQSDSPVRTGDEDGVEWLRNVGITGESLERFLRPLSCAVKGQLKVLQAGDEEEIFDLASDPLELNPVTEDSVPDEYRAELQRLRSVLECDAMRRTADVSEPQVGTEDVVSAELEERMKLLGYL